MTLNSILNLAGRVLKLTYQYHGSEARTAELKKAIEAMLKNLKG
jgi:hypothetical protein